MYEITIRGKQINSKGQFVKGSGVSATGETIHDALCALEKMTEHQSPNGGKGYVVKSSLRITSPNWEPGSNFGTATLHTPGGTVIGTALISY